MTGWRSLCSPPGGKFSTMTSTVPSVVPTHRHGEGDVSVFLVKVSQKWRAEIASRDSLSMLVTLELRDRLKELSLTSENKSVLIKKNGKLEGLREFNYYFCSLASTV